MSMAISDKSVLIFGCGNILWGDDGFGPAVIQHLMENYPLPDEVLALDVGTSIRDILFDLLLSEKKPKGLIIVDAVEYPERRPGEVFEIPVAGIPEEKATDFSLHQFPTVNLLQELQEQGGIQVKIIVAQTETIPQEVAPGLSQSMQGAVVTACERIIEIISQGGAT
jgi:coenzyme F420 hydrogenase subunit delta